MAEQLQLQVDKPITFVVRRLEDGTILDVIREEQLATYGTEKTWHEAACWAHIAIDADRKRRGEA